MVTVTGLLMVDCLSADWLSHGDLSFYLQWARREDQGDYFCYIQKEVRGEQRGTPAAARLKVSERSPDQTTSTPPGSPSVSASIHTDPVYAKVSTGV